MTWLADRHQWHDHLESSKHHHRERNLKRLLTKEHTLMVSALWVAQSYLAKYGDMATAYDAKELKRALQKEPKVTSERAKAKVAKLLSELPQARPETD